MADETQALLVQELRRPYATFLHLRAADTIEALTAQNEAMAEALRMMPDTIESLTAEVTRLRTAVRYAYEEGHEDARGEESRGIEVDWLDSLARIAALTKADQETGR